MKPTSKIFDLSLEPYLKGFTHESYTLINHRETPSSGPSFTLGGFWGFERIVNSDRLSLENGRPLFSGDLTEKVRNHLFLSWSGPLF